MAGATRHRVIIAAGMMAISMLLMGCMLEQVFEEYMGNGSSTWIQHEDVIQDAAQKEYQAEPDQTLASGQVLSVRVNYGKSEASQCQVRVENERNGWYDEIEDTAEAGVLGSGEKKYGDYPFGFENFNRQLTQSEYYDPKDAKGEYRVTVTASTGYSATAKVTWDGERFSPNLLAFSLD
ncbi:MAG: hypothetical protein JXE06_07080 [Coriobacteriia bacterium]|nr:hypothetical protein [Coriobacteriia bacterium]MBN2822269.1 hypothetical protein [Coriobacteriia bacterium]